MKQLNILCVAILVSAIVGFTNCTADAQTFKLPVIKRQAPWTTRYNREEDEDLQLWPQSITNINRGKWLFEFDVNPRIGYRITRLDQLLLRTFVGYRVKPWFAVWVGAYPWTPFFEPRYINEQRTLQQIGFEKTFGRVAASLRARIEQRYISHIDDVSWRLRFSPRINYFLDDKRSIYIYTTDEPFINFNTVSTGIQKGFAQNRWTTGIGFPIYKNRVRMEVAYLNQWVRRDYRNTNIPNRVNHNIVLNLITNF